VAPLRPALEQGRPGQAEDLDFFCGELAKAEVFRHTYDRFKDAKAVIFGTTDSFKTAAMSFNPVAVDMETHALCQVAKMYDIELRVYRVVSDIVGFNRSPEDDTIPFSCKLALNELATNIVSIHSN